MAKRKRLSGPLQDHFAPSDTSSDAEPKPTSSYAPIARIAGETSVSAAFDEIRQELDSARTEGRLVQRLPLDQIETDWLIRDRINPGTTEDPDFAALLDSLRQHGQRSPIEVADMGQGRYGLISGWRRLTALHRLHEETSEARFATVLALLRHPQSAQNAYVAMVEENEVRLGLSYYERARIAAKAVEAGIYPTTKTALQSLFATASRAKRSKIGSFLTLYKAFDDTIRFPQALTERLGLSLAKIVGEDTAVQARLRTHLQVSSASDPETEQALLAAFISAENEGVDQQVSESEKPSKKSRKKLHGRDMLPGSDPTEISPGIYLGESGGTLHLSGPAVNAAFRNALEEWLSGNAQD